MTAGRAKKNARNVSAGSSCSAGASMLGGSLAAIARQASTSDDERITAAGAGIDRELPWCIAAAPPRASAASSMPSTSVRRCGSAAAPTALLRYLPPTKLTEPPMLRPRRSLLFMPGSNPRALEKARALPADGLILDLEDAVAPEAKDVARGQVARGAGRRRLWRRASWCCGSTASTRPGAMPISPRRRRCRADAVLLPKVESAGRVRPAAALLDAPARRRARRCGAWSRRRSAS